MVIREGEDVALFATGTMVAPALEAADLLKAKSVDASVVNVHTIKPLDTVTINRIARKCGCAVSAEEHSIIGGLGSAIAESLVGHYPIPMKILGVNDTFGQSGEYAELLELHGLTTKHIADSANMIMKVQK